MVYKSFKFEICVNITWWLKMVIFISLKLNASGIFFTSKAAIHCHYFRCYLFSMQKKTTYNHKLSLKNKSFQSLFCNEIAKQKHIFWSQIAKCNCKNEKITPKQEKTPEELLITGEEKR